MMSLHVFDSVRDKVSQLMSAREEVLAVYIFGSVATGRLRPNSDIDIAVLVDTALVSGDLFKCRLLLMADLRQILARPDVEVLILNEAPPVLAQNVIAKGRLLFERSRSARIAFQIRTLNTFLDAQPMRDQHLQALKKRYPEG
jgi:uncharacterized protein